MEVLALILRLPRGGGGAAGGGGGALDVGTQRSGNYNLCVLFFPSSESG